MFYTSFWCAIASEVWITPVLCYLARNKSEFSAYVENFSKRSGSLTLNLTNSSSKKVSIVMAYIINDDAISCIWATCILITVGIMIFLSFNILISLFTRFAAMSKNYIYQGLYVNYSNGKSRI